jgi:hypothetical protein
LRNTGSVHEDRAVGSSRDSAVDAGWRDDGVPTTWPGLVRDRVNARWTEFSWLAVRSLLDSANDKVASNVHDLVNARRMRWVAAQRAAGADPDFRCFVRRPDGSVIQPDAETLSFLLVGDPGEGDASQYALVAPLKAKAPGTDFMLLASDVIYPAGDVNDYENAFFLPYWWYDRPILGQPGNHDWYDGLAGFMWHFCGAEPLPPTEYRASSFTTVERVARSLWRQASRPNRARLLAWRAKLASVQGRRWDPPQPGPYYSIEVRDLKVLVIDTGITGVIDRQQGDWLLRESAGPKPKLLITGKPVYVNNEYHPGPIVWNEPGPRAYALTDPPYRTVDDVVRDPERNFVAVIGGDTHSYQHYTVRYRPGCHGGDAKAERTIEYVVSGGGGAYMSATHTFGTIDIRHGHTKDVPKEVQAVTEQDYCSYPLRGDSVAYYAAPLGAFLAKWSLRAALALAGIVAAVLLAEYWRTPGEVEGLPWPAALLTVAATLVGLFGIGVAAFGAHWVSGKLGLKGYRFFCAMSVLLAGLLGAVWGLRELDVEDGVWIMVGATIASLVVPVAAVLIGYLTRTAGPLFTGDLVVILAVAAAVVVAFGLEPWEIGWLALLAGTFAVLTLAVPLVGAIRRAGGKRLRQLMIRGAIVFALFAALYNWRHGAVTAVVLPIGVVLLVLVTVYLGFLGVCWRAVRALVHGDLSQPAPQRANAILALVQQELELPALPGRAAVADRGAKRVVKAIFAKRLMNKVISEAGDRNAPPFFKQFLRIDVEDAVLHIRCYGATGWAQDALDPPLEDDIHIALAPAGG